MRAIAVPGFAAQFIAGGGREVDTARLTLDVKAGEHVLVTDESGEELGLAIADLENARLRVCATAADACPTIDGALRGWRVERALALRTKLGLPGPDHEYRLVQGAGDGLPGFACDVLGPTCVVGLDGATQGTIESLGGKLAIAAPNPNKEYILTVACEKEEPDVYPLRGLRPKGGTPIPP